MIASFTRSTLSGASIVSSASRARSATACRATPGLFRRGGDAQRWPFEQLRHDGANGQLTAVRPSNRVKLQDEVSMRTEVAGRERLDLRQPRRALECGDASADRCSGGQHDAIVGVDRLGQAARHHLAYPMNRDALIELYM